MAGDQKIQKQASPSLFDDISAVEKLLGLFTKSGGGTTTTEESTGGGTTTRQLQMSQEGMNYLLKQMMQAAPGIARQQGSAGMYNTNVRNLMLNDLMARSAGELAARTAPEVTTAPATTRTVKQTAPVKEATIDPKLGLGLGLAGLAWSKRDKIKKLFEGDGSGKGLTTSLMGGGVADFAGIPMSDALSKAGMDFAFGTDGGSNPLSLFGGVSDSSRFDMSMDLGSLGDIFNFGADSFFGSAPLDIAGFQVGDIGGIPITSALNFLGGNNKDGNAGEDLVLTALGTALGGPVGGFLGSVANDVPVVSNVVNWIGDIFSDWF